jgi:hypothetical protein
MKENRVSNRVLGYTVPVTDSNGQVRTFPAGTHESEIPSEFLSQITNPKAWERSPLADQRADVDGLDLDVDDDVPTKLEDCTVEQLHAIAERGIDGEPIELGRVRRKDQIIEILRAAGIDNE